MSFGIDIQGEASIKSVTPTFGAKYNSARGLNEMGDPTSFLMLAAFLYRWNRVNTPLKLRTIL